MLDFTKVTYEDHEIEQKIKTALCSSNEKDVVEVCCFPTCDGCCIKKGASSE